MSHNSWVKFYYKHITNIASYFDINIEREVRTRQDWNNNSSFVVDRYDFLLNLFDPSNWWIVIERPINEFTRACQSIVIVSRVSSNKSESCVNDRFVSFSIVILLYCYVKLIYLVQKRHSLNRSIELVYFFLVFIFVINIFAHVLLSE